MENKQPTLTVLPNITSLFSSFSEDEMEVGRIINSFPTVNNTKTTNDSLQNSTNKSNSNLNANSNQKKGKNFDFKTFDIVNPLFPPIDTLCKQSSQSSSSSLKFDEDDEEAQKAILYLKSPVKTKRTQIVDTNYSPKKLKLSNNCGGANMSTEKDKFVKTSPFVIKPATSSSLCYPSSSNSNSNSNSTSLCQDSKTNQKLPVIQSPSPAKQEEGNRGSSQLDSTLLSRLLHGALYHNTTNNDNSNNNNEESKNSNNFIYPSSSENPSSNFDNNNNNNNNNSTESSNINNNNNSTSSNNSTTAVTPTTSTVPSMDFLTKLIATKGVPSIGGKTEVKYLLKMFKRINGNQPWIESSIAPPMIGKMRKITIELEDLFKPLQLNVNISKIKTKGNQSCLVVSENNKVYKKNQKIEGAETYSTIFYPFKGKQFKNLFLKPCWICFGPRKDRPVFRVVISICDLESGFSKVLHCWNTEVHCHKMESSLKGKLLDNFNNPTFLRNSFSL